MKISTGQEYAAKIINTKKLSARGEYTLVQASHWCVKHAAVDHSEGIASVLAPSPLKPASSFFLTLWFFMPLPLLRVSSQ